MSALDNESLVIVQLFQIFLYKTILKPVLTYLTCFAISYQLIGIESYVETEVIVNHHLECFALQTVTFVLVYGFCLQVALRTETICIDTASCAQFLKEFGSEGIMKFFRHIAQSILQSEYRFFGGKSITAVGSAAYSFLEFRIFRKHCVKTHVSCFIFHGRYRFTGSET